MLMSFLEMYWKPIAAVLLGLIIFTAGYSRGYSHEKAVYEAYRYQSEALAHVAEAHATNVLENQKKITENITKEYTNAVDKLKNYYAVHPNIKWLREPIPSGGEMSNISNSSSSVDATAESNPASSPGATPLDCASDVMQLLMLQDWVKQQQEVK